MSRGMKMIENPEVPGLERSLPPPPPPLPPPLPPLPPPQTAGFARNSDKGRRATVAMQEDFIDSTAVEAGARLQGGAVHPSATKHPWWILTESDTVEVPPQSAPGLEAGTAWMEVDQKDIPASGNAKGKFFKRKSECIDPVQDAERVADAQKELSALMKPLQCDLCNAMMNSTLQAKLHYDGKPHQKKVSMFLNQSVKKLKPDEGPIASTTNNSDWNTYCDVCKTWFTSLVDASQHYAGKKHIRATTGASKPKTKKPQTPQAPIDPTGRFGIGVPFAAEALANPQLVEQLPMISAPLLSPVDSPVNPPNLNWPYPTFRCEICDVTANRCEQLEAHKRGARHLRMIKLRSLENPDVDDASDAPPQPVPSSIDYSIYRTPSGQYYCAPCNRSFHSEHSFAHHTESKKHKTQTNPKQPAPSLASNKKPSKLSK